MKADLLQGFLQKTGIASRRVLRRAINLGEVSVNGQVVTDPRMPVNPAKDRIIFRDMAVRTSLQRNRYFLFHKPVGVLSTLRDPSGRPTISDFTKDIQERVYPVGRLDYYSEGLLLLTNDGELANLVMAPKNLIPKEYRVKIKGELAQADREKLERGIILDDRPIMPFRIRALKKTPAGHSWLQVTVFEGKKHLIRNAFFFSGYPVLKLQRTAIGCFRLDRLKPGCWRELETRELERFQAVYNSAGIKA